MWEMPPTVSCSPLQQFSVSLTLTNGTTVYSGSFNQSTTFTQTIPLDSHTVYTATITDVCGTTCSVNCSISGKNANQLVCYMAS